MHSSFRKRTSLSRIREGLFGFPIELDNKVLVGTHHKSGTVWMRRVFSQISNHFRLRLHVGEQADLPPDFDIFFQSHSRFDLSGFPMEYRGLHLMRDPRDLIISGCFYHQKSKEKWLHVPKEKFGGLTYQEKINSYESVEDRILFEMNNAASRGIARLLKWDFTNSRFMNVRYEDLIVDEELLTFHRIFTFLGIPGAAIPAALRIAYENSLFSGNFKRSVHIRSGRASQWKEYFTPKHKARFLELFGDALIRMGYETDNGWANE